MSVLIQMRQRMRAVETIKKITHAMRLTSMSMHSRLRSKKKFLEDYKEQLYTLFSQVYAQVPTWQHTVLLPTKTHRNLVILVGTQKGLCGNFNAILYFFAQQHMMSMNRDTTDVIIIGKKMLDYAILANFGTIIKKYPDFHFTLLDEISSEIINIIFSQQIPYSSVTIFSNYPKTFFNQKPQATQIIPFANDKQPQDKGEFVWEQNPTMVLNSLAHNLIAISIQESLFLSLIAEQAARFITMDSSSRNANNLLDAMRLNYNKLRQTKITRELTDLVGGFF